MSEREARAVIERALTARHEELSGEASPRDFDGASQILRALSGAGFSVLTADEVAAMTFTPAVRGIAEGGGITDEAVEAAARVDRASRVGYDDWATAPERAKVALLAHARRVLEAALPMLGLQQVPSEQEIGRALGLVIAGLEAEDAGCLEWAHCPACPNAPGPCACSGDAMADRRLVDVVLALFSKPAEAPAVEVPQPADFPPLETSSGWYGPGRKPAEEGS